MARPAQDLGDGPLCPEAPDHKLYVSNGGRLWCPVTQAIYGPATFSESASGFVAGPLLREGDRRHVGEGSVQIFAELQREIA